MPELTALWRPAIEITILWFTIYRLILFFENTRAVQVVRGIVILLAAFLIFQKLDFQVLDWLMTKLFGISVIAILVIFHPELRQGLARLGQRHLFSNTLKEKELVLAIREIAKAAEALAKDKLGALIAIEKDSPLAPYIQSGITIDSRICAELIQSIFSPNSLLHDGALIIQAGRLMAAACILPLSANQDLSRIFGTRHRAALGLSEETDAIVVVVSEERGDISIVYRGKLFRDLSMQELEAQIKKLAKAGSEERGG
jgi:diadenylate cyclase